MFDYKRVYTYGDDWGLSVRICCSHIDLARISQRVDQRRSGRNWVLHQQTWGGHQTSAVGLTAFRWVIKRVYGPMPVPSLRIPYSYRSKYPKKTMGKMIQHSPSAWIDQWAPWLVPSHGRFPYSRRVSYGSSMEGTTDPPHPEVHFSHLPCAESNEEPARRREQGWVIRILQAIGVTKMEMEVSEGKSHQNSIKIPSKLH